MRRFIICATSLMLAVSMLVAPDMAAQTRSTNGGSTRSTNGSSTRSSSGSSTRSSGTQVRSSSGSSSGSSGSQVRSSSGSSTRSSGTSSSSQVRSSSGSSTRSSGTQVRSSSGSSSGSSGSQVRSSSGSSTRSSGTSSSSQVRSSSGSSTRSSGTSSSSQVRTGSSNNSGSSQVRSSSSSSSSSSSQVRSSSGSSTRSSGTSGSSQVRSSSSSSSSSSQVRSSSSSSSSGSQVRSSSSSSSSGSQVRSSSGTSSSSSQVRSSSGTSSSGSQVRSSSSSSSSNGSQVRSGSTSPTGGTVRSTNVNRDGLSGQNSAVEQAPVKENYRDESFNYRYHDDMRVDDRHNMYRVPPRHRDPMPWDRAGYFWGDHPHYYGYRIVSLPPSYRRISHWGIDYYYYNGIYYRPYGGAYVVCRPPFGTPLEAAIDRAILRAIRFAYYCDTYRTFERTFDYYNVIARQNLIIAQQNARIIAQNYAYAMNGDRALSAYELANRLGLVQSYANAGSDYFYQDGVFYTISASGLYTTIVPPAGALVTSLPDDYEVIVMNGIEYYMVDNTVYRTTLFEGQPYLEVLGQMYGSLYSQYNVYR